MSQKKKKKKNCANYFFFGAHHRMDQLSNEVRQKLATVRPETLVCVGDHCTTTIKNSQLKFSLLGGGKAN